MDHVTGHDHDHAHGGGHDHHHDEHSDELLEQLLTVGICGAFGVVAILLGRQAIATNSGMLAIILAKPFWIWVLIGGGVLTLLSVIRGVALWRATSPNHVHTEDCGHDHAPGESHDHGGVFWRVVVLMFPLVLFFLGLPNAGFSDDRIRKMLGPDIELNADNVKDVEARGDVSLTFNDISEAMRDPARMEALTGMRATVRGMLQPTSERQFTLFTTKMTCCAADMVPLKAKIIVQNDDSGGSLQARGYKHGDWLEVKGVLQFVKLPNSEQWLPVISTKLKNITPTNPE